MDPTPSRDAARTGLAVTTPMRTTETIANNRKETMTIQHQLSTDDLARLKTMPEAAKQLLAEKARADAKEALKRDIAARTEELRKMQEEADAAALTLHEIVRGDEQTRRIEGVKYEADKERERLAFEALKVEHRTKLRKAFLAFVEKQVDEIVSLESEFGRFSTSAGEATLVAKTVVEESLENAVIHILASREATYREHYQHTGHAAMAARFFGKEE